MATASRQTTYTHRLGTIYVKPDDALKLAELAEEDGSTVNELVRRAIQTYLRRRARAGALK